MVIQARRDVNEMKQSIHRNDIGDMGFEAAGVLQAAGCAEHGRFHRKLLQKGVNVVPAARRHQRHFVPILHGQEQIAHAGDQGKFMSGVDAAPPP